MYQGERWWPSLPIVAGLFDVRAFSARAHVDAGRTAARPRLRRLGKQFVGAFVHPPVAFRRFGCRGYGRDAGFAVRDGCARAAEPEDLARTRARAVLVSTHETS